LIKVRFQTGRHHVHVFIRRNWPRRVLRGYYRAICGFTSDGFGTSLRPANRPMCEYCRDHLERDYGIKVE